MSEPPGDGWDRLRWAGREGRRTLVHYRGLFVAIIADPLGFFDRAMAPNTPTVPLSPLAYLATAFAIVALVAPLQGLLSHASGIVDALAQVLGLPPGFEPPREIPGVVLINLSELTGVSAIDNVLRQGVQAAVYGGYAWVLWQLLGTGRVPRRAVLGCVGYSLGTLLVVSELIAAVSYGWLIVAGGDDPKALVDQYLLLGGLDAIAVLYFFFGLPARWLSHGYGLGFVKTAAVLAGGLVLFGVAVMVALQLIWAVTGVGIEFF
ncbi:MAG: hypothetical protein ACFCBW_21140 [Candidatus Competibacterales bacterium]